MSDFNPNDASTWPVVLTLDQVAAIYQRSREAIRHALKPCSRTRFTPQPFKRSPARWRRVDVLRDVEGARVTSHLTRVG
jgi:hypothetical protein